MINFLSFASLKAFAKRSLYQIEWLKQKVYEFGKRIRVQFNEMQKASAMNSGYYQSELRNALNEVQILEGQMGSFKRVLFGLPRLRRKYENLITEMDSESSIKIDKVHASNRKQELMILNDEHNVSNFSYKEITTCLNNKINFVATLPNSTPEKMPYVISHFHNGVPITTEKAGSPMTYKVLRQEQILASETSERERARAEALTPKEPFIYMPGPPSVFFYYQQKHYLNDQLIDSCSARWSFANTQIGKMIKKGRELADEIDIAITKHLGLKL